MLTLEEVRFLLQDRSPSRVAEACALHYNTIRDLRDNPDANPSYRVLKTVADYLEGKEAAHG